MAAYELALEQGADFVELDLVPTGDGHLIARHENALAVVELDAAGGIVLEQGGRPKIREATTDVADRHPDLMRLLVGFEKSWFERRSAEEHHLRDNPEMIERLRSLGYLD